MQIIVHAYEHCPYSQRAVELCESLWQEGHRGVKWYVYEDRDHPRLRRLAREYNYHRVPLVLVNGQALSDGYDELVSLLNRPPRRR